MPPSSASQSPSPELTFPSRTTFDLDIHSNLDVLISSISQTPLFKISEHNFMSTDIYLENMVTCLLSFIPPSHPFSQSSLVWLTNGRASASNLGPQTSFPVPEGILNHQGKYTIALSLWAFESTGAKLDGLFLKADGIVETSMREVESVSQPSWKKRDGAY